MTDVETKRARGKCTGLSALLNFLVPKRLGIFRPNFTHILNVPIYVELQICIQ